MRYRRLGCAGIEVSEIGFGTWQLGGNMWGPVDRDEALRAMNRAVELGVTFFDTALVYGMGESERIVGEFVRKHGQRDRLHVASKVPPKNMRWPAREVPIDQAFPKDHVRAMAERSLHNLGMERIALLQLHVWAERWTDELEWFDAMDALRREGKIGAIGISINSHHPETALRIVESGKVDVLQVVYNIFDQTPDDALLPACAKHDVGFIARVPFDEGGLTGRLTGDEKFPPEDFRSSYFAGALLRETIDRAKKLDFLLHDDIKTLPEAALRFCLSSPAVSTVIPGMRKVAHVESNCATSDRGPLPKGDLERLEAHRWVPRA